jgi:hypothetical protein
MGLDRGAAAQPDGQISRPVSLARITKAEGEARFLPLVNGGSRQANRELDRVRHCDLLGADLILSHVAPTLAASTAFRSASAMIAIRLCWGQDGGTEIFLEMGLDT